MFVGVTGITGVLVLKRMSGIVQQLSSPSGNRDPFWSTQRNVPIVSRLSVLITASGLQDALHI